MKSHKGIRRKILLNTSIVVVILSAALVGVMSYFMASLTDAILIDTLQPMAKSAAQNVESNMHMLADRMLLIRDNDVFADPTSGQPEKLAVLNRTKGGIEFVWLALYTPDGKLYTGSENSPTDIASRSLFENLIQTENLAIENTSVGENGLEIAIGTPVYSKDKKPQLLYYLVGSYKYDVLNDVMSSINVSSNSTAFIIDEKGGLVAHQDNTKVKNKQTIFDTLGSDDKINDIFKNMSSGQTGAETFSMEKGQRLISFAPVRGTHWSLAIVAPRNDFMGPANQGIITSIFITGGLLILALLFTIQLARRIQIPLARVTNRLSTLAEGDLHSEIATEKTKDEIQTLSEALGETVHSINSYTTELSRVLSELSESDLDVAVEGEFRGDFITMKDSLNQIVDFLNQIMESLQNASSQVSQTSHMVSENATQVQISSESQSESLNDLRNEAEAIGENIQEISQQTIKVNELIEKAVNRLQDGEKQMKSLLNSMKDISENSDEISKINKFLEDIAFQTNILALNAAVEAARAGEAGKGFAVVADEVQNLAAKSSNSAQRTSTIINNSQLTIDEGSAYADQTAGSLNDIALIAKDVSLITEQLNEAVEAQKASLETITSQINNVNALASDNLNSSLNSAQASKTLTEQADKMQNMASKFKLRQKSMDRRPQ